MQRRSPTDFHDESIRPDQHYSSSRSGPLAEGERRLMIAILEDAMACARTVIKRGGTGGDPDLEMAMAWFDDQDTDYIFSFESICEFLEIRSEDVRDRLEELGIGRVSLTHRHFGEERHTAMIPRDTALPAHSAARMA